MEGIGKDLQQGDQQQDTTAQGEGSQGEDEGPMTQAQADRLLESIDEGQPRTLVQGLPGGKPW